MSEEPRDYRLVGPVLYCPGCECRWFQVLMVFDEETQLPGCYATTAACANCEAYCIIPTPLDEIPREVVHVGADEDAD